MVQGRRLVAVGALASVVLLSASAGGFAAGKITSAQIKDGTITSRDVKDRTIGERDLADVSVSLDKLTDEALFDLRGVGPAGPSGPAGPAGPAGIASIRRVDGPKMYQGTSGAGSVQLSFAACPAGSVATGGGFDATGVDNIVSYAVPSTVSYAVIAVNHTGSPQSVQGYVLCASGNGVAVAAAHARGAVPAGAKARLREIRDRVVAP